MNIKAFVGVLLLGGLILVLGIGLGTLLSKNKVAPSQDAKNQVVLDAIALLNSKIVSSVMARGTVTQIEGTKVTLTYDGATQPVAIKSDANITKLVFVPGAKANQPKYTTNAGSFSDLKVGDNLEMMVRVFSDGRVEGFNVTILPVPPSPTEPKK